LQVWAPLLTQFLQPNLHLRDFPVLAESRMVFLPFASEVQCLCLFPPAADHIYVRTPSRAPFLSLFARGLSAPPDTLLPTRNKRPQRSKLLLYLPPLYTLGCPADSFFHFLDLLAHPTPVCFSCLICHLFVFSHPNPYLFYL